AETASRCSPSSSTTRTRIGSNSTIPAPLSLRTYSRPRRVGRIEKRVNRNRTILLNRLPPARSGLACRKSSRVSGLFFRWLGICQGRQSEVKYRAASGGSLCPYAASVSVDNATANGQTDSGAGIGIFSVEPLERSKNLF